METMERVKTRKSEFYANGVEVQRGDYPIAKEILTGMPKFRGKLSNYGELTQKKQTILPTLTGYAEIERFIVKDFEFIVVTTKSMSFSLDTMVVSKPTLGTQVYWQRIK
jgi:hypothetical protein